MAAWLVVLLGSVAIFSGLLHSVAAFDILWINVVAASAVAWYLFGAHPDLRRHWMEMGDE